MKFDLQKFADTITAESTLHLHVTTTANASAQSITDGKEIQLQLPNPKVSVSLSDITALYTTCSVGDGFWFWNSSEGYTNYETPYIEDKQTIDLDLS